MEDHQSPKKPRRGPIGKNEKSDSLVTDINMSDYYFTMTTESIDKTLQMSFDESIDQKHLQHSPQSFNETSTCGFSISNENCGKKLDSKESTSKIMESEVFSEERYEFDLKQSVEAEMKSGDPDLDELLALIQSENEHLLPDDGDVLDIDSDDDLRLDGLSEKADHDELDSQTLYPDAAVSVGAFMLLLAVFTTKYNLTGDATQQLLNIIAFALPSGHMLCTKLNEFKHFFKNLRNPLVYHYYCDNCLGYIGDNSVKVCPCDFCRANFNTKQAAYFCLEIPLEKQIQNLFAQDGCYESLEYRFKRNVADDIYQDIYDGKVYKTLLKDNEILSFQENLSFTFNTDGAPVFNSKVSVWPIYLVINKLPYKQRMRKENMILASLWFGSKKPSMGTYLKPLQQSMKKLSQGIKCTSPNIGCFDSKAILFCGTADLPARSMLCNHVQYNGAFSCWKCEQEGISAAVGKGHARVSRTQVECQKGLHVQRKLFWNKHDWL